jgi:hypothetical protein
MASIIRIKRSSVSGNPATLGAGELAYSALTDNGSNGGDRLYIGIGAETSGNAANHFVIGGKYFTDMLDHTPGVLTASSALVVDSNKKLDELLVDNLSLNGSTVSSTGDLILSSASGVVLQTSEFISGGSYGGNRLYLPTGGGATLQSGYEGGVTLRASTNNTDWVTVTLATSGALSVPGTITTASNGNLTLAPNGTGKTVITNAYIGDTSTSLAEYIYDTVGGAVTGTANQISVTNSDGGNTSTIALINTAVTAGSYGSSTAIPTFTVDAQGRLTAAGTASITTTLTVAADSGTGNGVALASDTLTIAGGTGLTSSITGDTVTIDIDNTVATLTGSQTLTNKTISGSSNTLSNIANSSLTNSSVTINGTSVSLGASATVTAAAGTLTGTTLNATVVTSSLTSVGTIATGVWQGTDIGVAYGGTGTSDGSITGTGALTFTAGGSNTNVNLVPLGTGTVDVASKRITSLADPTGAQDAATKAYVDAVQTGLDLKASVRAATTANITLSNTQTVDGVALSVGDRVLVKNQSTGSQNGIYVVASGSWGRSTDCDNTPGTEVTSGLFTFVEEGTTNADSGWVLTTDSTITVGTTALTFVQFSGAGQITAGAALTKTGNTLDVAVDDTTIEVNSDALRIKSTYVGQTSITTLGTVSTGTWNGTVIAGQYGGTGVNNSGKTITLGGSFTHTGAHTLGLTTTANTSVTLPTTGTLATLAGTETFTNKTLTSPTINAGTLSGTFSGNHTKSGVATFSNTTDATSTTAAGVIMSGGLALAKSMYVGINITGAGAATSTLDGFNIDGGTY